MIEAKLIHGRQENLGETTADSMYVDKEVGWNWDKHENENVEVCPPEQDANEGIGDQIYVRSNFPQENLHTCLQAVHLPFLKQSNSTPSNIDLFGEDDFDFDGDVCICL